MVTKTGKMLKFYRYMMNWAKPQLISLLNRRAKRGKEDPERLHERKGQTFHKNGFKPLIWVHAASVGEAQSALILIDALLKSHENLHILVTTGTVTSAKMMEKSLPERAFHQFYPLDHPDWVVDFLDYWNPDLILWTESEIWPNMIQEIKARNIPAALINARLSMKSFKRWRLIRKTAQKLLDSFAVILAQSDADANYFRLLGVKNVQVTDNLKFSAKALHANTEDLNKLSAHLQNRPVWLFASTHKGEEEMACRVHQIVKNTYPELLTVIVPRHPDRREEIRTVCENQNLKTALRGKSKNLPDSETDIYIADTMGELGLFYRLASIACVGRSFSDDGGGGHNPIEPAQLNCAVLHGPNIQYQQQIYDEMNAAGAALKMHNENELIDTIRTLLGNAEDLSNHQKTAMAFAKSKEAVIDRVLENLAPLLEAINTRPKDEWAEQA